ncbi:GFA family protein [Legionella spiritensis]|uniref:Glutathione-dependent formaldehyde-activating enzyme n=1 Tax=Legionella spiritensis TaxID=452 RepID=A0A0W0YY07_LEGSP|nr:GFA family protein [Legionella spiritensis]KTD61707.1 Glutathione-dependent formaldehyde-activating enzyme [Legionella spiritensis]SNV38838.1 Uncharacterized conserved protein [Legionella spiritensis]
MRKKEKTIKNSETIMKLTGSCHCQSVRFECLSHTPYPYMRCYCSICRKTAGGGGYAINIMGDARTLKVHGEEYITVYRARLSPEDPEPGTGQRHFCKVCGSCLWVFDPEWPQLIHPFASAIDTPLPIPPEQVHIMTDYAAPWCEIPKGEHHSHHTHYPPLSIEEWHKKLGLWI